ncbi:MAG TPA: ROK family protein [Saprospiraceae bacterium]|nr:ROK family protein [Saprospiraceae bacterium]
MNKIAIGADIGGSHITCQLYDLQKETLLDGTKVRVPVDSNAPKELILDAWCKAISLAASAYDLRELAGIGFAMPGPFDYPEGIARFEGVQKFDALNGVNVRAHIQHYFGLNASYPVRFLNDATCFAIGESFRGEAAKFSKFLAITLGTGFGASFIHNHLPVAGKDGASDDGYLWHLPFGDSNADNHFSTRWFQKAYKEKTGNVITGVKELVERFDQESVIGDIFDLFGKNLGDFTGPWLKSFNAQALVIGGNISLSYPYFKSVLESSFKNQQLQVSVIISGLQEDAALSGSAHLCDDELYENLT